LRVLDLPYLSKTRNPMLSHHLGHLPQIVHQEPINIPVAPRGSRTLQPIMRIIKEPWGLTVKFRIQQHVSRAVTLYISASLILLDCRSPGTKLAKQSRAVSL